MMKVYDYFNNRFFYKNPSGKLILDAPLKQNTFYFVNEEQASKLKQITFYSSLPAFVVYSILAGVVSSMDLIDVTLANGLTFCVFVLTGTYVYLERFYLTLGLPVKGVNRDELEGIPSTLYEKLFYASLAITIVFFSTFLWFVKDHLS